MGKSLHSMAIICSDGYCWHQCWLVFLLVFCEIKYKIIKAVSEALGYSKISYVQGFCESVGTRNDVDEFEMKEFIPSQPIFKNVDGVRFTTHTIGCGGTRQDT